MFADDKFLGNKKDGLGNNVYFWNGTVVGDSFFSREVPSIASWLFWACHLFVHWPHLFLCLTLNVKTLPEVWLWMTRGPGPRGLIVWLGIGLWARLSGEGIIGPVVRKLVKWSPGSSPDCNPLVSLKSLLWSSAHFHLECWPLAVLMRMN